MPKMLLDKTRELDENPTSILQEIRSTNIGKIIIGHLNANSLRNKFDAFVISETKLDESYPMCQFKIHGFSTPF